MSKQTEFISTVAHIAQAEYANRNHAILPSVCIAQAALESGWNLKAKTLFGIKGKGETLKTTEFINGKYVSVTDSFRTYPDLTASIDGYYEFLLTNKRYSGAIGLSDPKTQIAAIARAGYATDPNYASKVMSIIRTYNLAQYDNTNIECENKNEYFVNTPKGLNIRKEANSKSAKLGAIPYNSTVSVNSNNGSWYSVTYNGVTGYVYSKYLSRK